MTTTPLGWAAVNAADALGSVFNALINTGYATTAAIDNTEATVGSAAFDVAELWLVMSSPITVGSSAPFIVATVLPSYDGTNYESAFVSGTTLYPIENSSTKPLVASGVYPLIRVRLAIPPTLFKITVLNNSGAAFTSTVTASLYRMRGQAG